MNNEHAVMKTAAATGINRSDNNQLV